MDTKIVKDWLESLGIDDIEMAIELIDCPVNGLEVFANEYGTESVG